MKVKTQNKLLTVLASVYLIGFLVEVFAITYIAVFVYSIQNTLLR